MRLTLLLVVLSLVACGDGIADVAPALPAVQAAVAPQAASIGASYSFDAAQNNRTFSDPAGGGLSYVVTFSGPARGLVAAGARITGVPDATGIVRGVLKATDARGRSVSTDIAVVVFSAGLMMPVLPAQPNVYAGIALPAHFLAPGPGGGVVTTDNTPSSNPTTDAGAALGRVLFYDGRLSANDGISCASCHQQQTGFSDPDRLSSGFAGGSTARHSMSLANARFYRRGRFFWDERAATLEAQVLQPIADPVEMGMPLEDLVLKLQATTFYAPLFAAAFGSPDITSERVARALAQFTRSLVSFNSRFDASFAGAAQPNLGLLTPQEAQGFLLFADPAVGCARCHGTHAHIAGDVFNTGLDATITDAGAGNGRFKVPSLRNVAVRGRFMHDGRFTTLQEVVEHYDSGVRNNPGLDPGLRAPGGQPRRLNLTVAQKDAIVAFLHTLTDAQFLADSRFADPFAR
jgi:cytochrome c peroxidase